MKEVYTVSNFTADANFPAHSIDKILAYLQSFSSCSRPHVGGVYSCVLNMCLKYEPMGRMSGSKTNPPRKETITVMSS